MTATPAGLKFVTRAHARVDRIACPWLIRRFMDPHAEILFVPHGEVAAVAERGYTDDHRLLEVEVPVCDALYESCRLQLAAQ